MASFISKINVFDIPQISVCQPDWGKLEVEVQKP